MENEARDLMAMHDYLDELELGRVDREVWAELLAEDWNMSEDEAETIIEAWEESDE